MLDDRVQRIVSIDLRPEVTPDERGKGIPYDGNSTQRMLDNLAGLPGADLGEIHTIDADTRSLTPADVPVRPEPSFIDGEHTNESCLADARLCRSVAAPQAVIAFHDAPIIHRAIWAFIAERRAAGEQVVAYPLPNHVFVVEIGDPRIWATRAIRSLVGDPRFPLPDPVADLLARRPVGGVARWPLLDAWLTRVGAGKPYLRKSAQRYRKRKQLKVQRRRMAKKRSARSTSCGATSASERVKLLFALTHAGLFRNFDSTLRELVARGHEVHVSFDTARYPSDAFTALEAASPALTSALSPPVVDDRWQVLGRHVRAASDYIRYRDPRYAGAPKLRRLRGLEYTPRERLRSLLLKPYNRVAGFDDANRVRFLQALFQRGVVARVPKARDYTGRFRIDFPATALGLSLTRQIQQESECETLPFTFDFYAMRTAEPGVMF